jgi:putative endonuclease
MKLEWPRAAAWLIERWRAWFNPGTLGQQGEAAAARFLRRLGYKILVRGDRVQLGELDLVAVDGRTLVFVEVKTRRSTDLGEPSEAVDQVKQRRLTRLALGYMKRHGLLSYPARFDVIAVVWPEGQRHPQIEHIKNAFQAQGFDGLYS